MLLGIQKPIRPPLASEFLIETCKACLYSNQSLDKTDRPSMLRVRNTLFIPATSLIFGLIIEKFSKRIFILPGPCTMQSCRHGGLW